MTERYATEDNRWFRGITGCSAPAYRGLPEGSKQEWGLAGDYSRPGPSTGGPFCRPWDHFKWEGGHQRGNRIRRFPHQRVRWWQPGRHCPYPASYLSHPQPQGRHCRPDLSRGEGRLWHYWHHPGHCRVGPKHLAPGPSGRRQDDHAAGGGAGPGWE